MPSASHRPQRNPERPRFHFRSSPSVTSSGFISSKSYLFILPLPLLGFLPPRSVDISLVNPSPLDTSLNSSGASRFHPHPFLTSPTLPLLVHPWHSSRFFLFPPPSSLLLNLSRFPALDSFHWNLGFSLVHLRRW